MDPDIQVLLWNWISVVIFTWNKETPDEAVRFLSCLGFKVLEHLITLHKNSCLFWNKNLLFIFYTTTFQNTHINLFILKLILIKYLFFIPITTYFLTMTSLSHTNHEKVS